MQCSENDQNQPQISFFLIIILANDFKINKYNTLHEIESLLIIRI